MRFRISLHTGHGAADGALDVLAEKLGTRHGDATFTRRGPDIVATWGEDVPVSMERDEREEIGREAVLEILGEVCERAPELNVDWFAVSAQRY